MNESNWKVSGKLEPEEVQLPAKDRLKQGAVAIVECPQRIPCDPCSQHCPVGAIEMDGLNDTPTVNFGKCTGCSLCVQYCPGLAIFLLDCSPEEGCDLTLPFEFDLPRVGEVVEALDRKGEPISSGTVKDVLTREDSAGDTPTVTVRLPEEYINRVRNIRRQK